MIFQIQNQYEFNYSNQNQYLMNKSAGWMIYTTNDKNKFIQLDSSEKAIKFTELKIE